MAGDNFFFLTSVDENDKHYFNKGAVKKGDR